MKKMKNEKKKEENEKKLEEMKSKIASCRALCWNSGGLLDLVLDL